MKSEKKISSKNDGSAKVFFFNPVLVFIAILYVGFLFSFILGPKKVSATISSTPVHQYTGSSLAGSGSYNITLTSTPTTSNTLIFIGAGNDTVNHHVMALTQTGVTWAKATSTTPASEDIWYGNIGSSPGTTLTVTLAGNGATSAVGNLSEWSGLSPIPLDQTGVNTGNSSTPATQAITPQAGADVLIIALARKGGTATVSAPFTALSSTDGSFSPSYRVVSNASGSYTANWSYTSSGFWTTAVADFLGQIVDATSPSIPSGLNGSAFSPTRIDLFWASSTDNQAVDYYTLYRCNGASCTPSTLVASSTVLSYSNTGLTSITTYGYAVTATDLQGNESSKSSTVYISTPSTDTLPPVLSDGSPTGTVTANPLNATLSLTTDESATCKYGTVASTAYASIANTFGTTGGTSHSQSLTGLSAGTNTYYVRCIDAATNANLSDYTITFTMALADITAPLISITAPTNGATVSNTVTFTASSSDNIGVVGVKFFLDGILFGTEKTGTSITSTSTTWASASFASDGVHTVFATVRDAAGNRATSSTITLNVNNNSNWKFRTVVYNGSTYNFSVFVPPSYTAATSWPIILAMTGQASFPFPDNDGYSQIRLDFGEYTIREAENTFPAITVFPQYVNTSGLTNNEAIALHDAIAMAAFNQELAEFNVDMNRVYLVGSSYGGLRAWGLMYNNSNLFAAMVTLSGGNSNPFEITGNASDTLSATNALTVTRLLTKPIWMFHSLGDGQALSQYDRDMYAAFQAASSTSVIYTQYPGSTHSLWVSPWGFNDPAITNPTVLEWLMAQTLDVDATPPTTPASLTGTVSPTQVALTWASSTDAGGVTAYKVYQCSGSSCSPTTFVATTTVLSYLATSLSQTTQYGFAVSAVDAVFNESSKSSTFATTTTSSSDVTSPTVSLTAPSDLATVSGSSVSVTANSADNVGVSGVQFKLDNVNLGSEDTTSTYGITWDSTSASNGSHTLLAVARDAAGNYATSTAVTVTVDNTAPILSSGSPSGTLTAATTTAIISVTTDESATCKYGTVASTAYASIANTFTTTGGTTHTKNLTGLTPASYTYYIRCIDASSNTNLSDYSISFTIPSAPDITAPTAPTSFTGAVSSTQVTLSWTSSTDAVGVTAYKVYRCAGSSCSPSTFIATTTVLFYIDTSLTQSTLYGFAVSAVDDAFNESSKSSTFATTTTATDIIPPVISSGSPSGILATSTNATILSVATDESASCKYGITPGVAYASISSNFTTTGGTSHSVSVNGLSTGSYLYYVRCIDGSSNANSSDTVISFSVPDGATSGGSSRPGGSHSGGGGAGTVPITSNPINVVDLINLNKYLFLEAYSKGITLSPLVLKILGINNNTAPESSLRIARDLQLNAIGTDVRRLQNFLISQGVGPAAEALKEHRATAIFGVLTQTALAEYQSSVGLPATGYCGMLTRKLLNQS